MPSVISEYCAEYRRGEITFDELVDRLRQVIPRRYGWDSDLYSYAGWPEDNPYTLDFTDGEIPMPLSNGGEPPWVTTDEYITLVESLRGDPNPDRPIVDLRRSPDE